MSDAELLQAAIEIINRIDYGSCDGCGNQRECVICGGINPILYEAKGHTADCPVGQFLKGCQK